MNPQAASALARIQMAMWVDSGMACVHCKRPYSSVDDMMERNPRVAATEPMEVVDDDCFAAWSASAPLGGE